MNETAHDRVDRSPTMITAVSDSITLEVSGRGDAAPTDLPVSAWRLDDGGVVVMVSEMALSPGTGVDAGELSTLVHSMWPDAQILERRPRDSGFGQDPRACVATYLEVVGDGLRRDPDYSSLESRGLRLSHH